MTHAQSLLKPLLLACLCAGAAPAAQAEIYKWVDERGVVNYSSAPPPGNRRATVLPADNPGVTVVPAPPRLPEADAEARRLRQRIERLEEEAGRKAGERHAEAETQARLEEARRRQCELDRVVDCEPEWWELGYPTVVVGVPQPLFRSPHFRPRPLPRHKGGRDFRLAPARENPQAGFVAGQRGLAGGR